MFNKWLLNGSDEGSLKLQGNAILNLKALVSIVEHLPGCFEYPILKCKFVEIMLLYTLLN